MTANSTRELDREACPITGSKNHSFHFDNLPDVALVRVPVACAVTGLRRSSLYAAASSGRAPRIEKLAGGRSSGVRVGELRRFLKDPSAYYAGAV